MAGKERNGDDDVELCAEEEEETIGGTKGEHVRGWSPEAWRGGTHPGTEGGWRRRRMWRRSKTKPVV